ncbi:MAG: 4-hydroxy-3-methylbut-2-enyl diphosphate reductase [Candidatus Latescibacteria bacterium]|nr:4-hydroxy-3-methylbut-2-enyl diphosphate reductase [Candidatus Latescibacterota bacterium]
MKVRVAKSAGFCMGVRKAMDTVLDVARGSNVTYTLGPLIHNPQALEMLESRNVYVTKDIDESLQDKTVVIRAHGVPPSAYRKLREAGARIVDATCPKVFRSQGIIKKYFKRGYSIVIVGDRGHAEIDALEGITGNTAIIVENLNDAKKLSHMEKVCVVAQTTLNTSHYREITDEIINHADECHIAETICASTERRQADVRKLAEQTDATVVVGGKSSANTQRLAEISRELGQPTYLIEDPSELDMEELSRYNEIGITAGASTPNWVIQQVVDTIAGYTPVPRKSIVGFLMSLAFLAIEGNFILGAGAVALTYAMCLFMAIPPYPRYFLLSFFYLFPLHTVNKYLEINWNKVVLSERASVVRLYWRILLSIAVISVLISLVTAWYNGAAVFTLVAVSYLLGGLYSIRILPVNWNFRFKRIRDIPGSKDTMIATAWTFATVALPMINHGSFPGISAVIGGAFAFILVFSRATILAIEGIESDKLVGLETIPILIGRQASVRLLYIFNILTASVISVCAVTGLLPYRTFALLLPIIYMLALIRPLIRTGQFFRLYHQVALDTVYFLAGIVAFLFFR